MTCLSQLHRGIVQASFSTLGIHVNEELEGCDVTAAVTPGENLMGSVWRITTQNVAIILKITHSTQAERDAYNSPTLFRNEITFYQQIIPELSSLLAVDQTVPAIPCSYQALCDGVNDAIVLQDLRPLGFRMEDRMKGLDTEHTSLVIRELAHFHSLSLAMKSKYPEKFNKLKKLVKEAFYDEDQRSNWAAVTAQTFEESAKEIDEALGKQYGDKIRMALSDGFDFFIKAVQPSEPWSVINHGDCWTNNVLFLYDDKGKPQQVRMLDFQISRYSSIGSDVMFFFCTSVQPEVLATNYEIFISEYYNCLCSSLKVQGIPLPELNVVQSEIERYCMYGIAKAFVALPFFMRPPTGSPSEVALDDKELSTADVMAAVACNTKRKTQLCRRWLARLVQIFLDRKIIY